MKKLVLALVVLFVLTLSACEKEYVHEEWRVDNIREEMQSMKTYNYDPTIKQEMFERKTK